MKTMNYCDMKKKVLDFYSGDVSFTTEFLREEVKREELLWVLGSLNPDEEIGDFSKIHSATWDIYLYRSRNVETNKEKEHLLLSDNYHPILSLEHYETMKGSLFYSQDVYRSYQEDRKRIESEIRTTILKNDEFEDAKVSVLDSDEFVKNDYFRKRYHFYIQDDEILLFEVEKEMFLNGEAGFENRSSSALKCIRKVFDKINKKVEKEEKIKEYSISRKK